MITIKIFIYRLTAISLAFNSIYFFMGCNNISSHETPEKNEPDPHSNAAELEKLLNTPSSGNGYTFDLSYTNHYHGFIPPAAILLDYNHKGRRPSPIIVALANIPNAFEKNLPQSIRDVLASHNLLGKGLVDIRFVVQYNITLGEKDDHSGVPTTTRICVHGWADPHAPASYSDDRVNRNFLHGVYESDKDISTPQHPLNQLIASPVQIHDKKFSPRADTDLIKLGANDESQAFWVMAIDNNNPDGNIRALATLLWVIDSTKHNAFEKLTAADDGTPKFKTFGELLTLLRNSPDFQRWHGLNLLNDLLK